MRKEKPNGDFVNQIKAIFESAKKETDGITIIFLDDMDKFANEDNRHCDAEEYVTAQSCIDDCKGCGIFALATVNDRYCLPGSLLRPGRFDKIIEVKVPQGKDAEKIVDHFLVSKQIMGKIDTEEIARIMGGKSCADLEAVINEAGIYAGFSGKSKIDQPDVVKACLRMIYSPDCINPSDDANMDKIATHEAGFSTENIATGRMIDYVCYRQ